MKKIFFVLLALTCFSSAARALTAYEVLQQIQERACASAPEDQFADCKRYWPISLEVPTPGVTPTGRSYPLHIDRFLTARGAELEVDRLLFNSVNDSYALDVYGPSASEIVLVGGSVVFLGPGNRDASECFEVVSENFVGRDGTRGTTFNFSYNPLCQYCTGGADEVFYAIFNYSVPSIQFYGVMAFPFRIPCRATLLLLGVRNAVNASESYSPRASDWGPVDYYEAVRRFIASMAGRGKSVRFVEMDSPQAMTTFGYGGSSLAFPSNPSSFSAETPEQSRRLVPIVRQIISKVNPSYTILLGGQTIIPMPFKNDASHFVTPDNPEGVTRFTPAYGLPPIEMRVGHKVPSDDLYSMEQDNALPTTVVSRLPTPVDEDYGVQSPQLIIQGLANMASPARIIRNNTLGIIDLCGSPDKCSIGDFSDRVFEKFWPAGAIPFNPSCPHCEPQENTGECRLCECSSDYYSLPGCYPSPETCKNAYLKAGGASVDLSSFCGQAKYLQGGTEILPGSVAGGARSVLSNASTIYFSAHGAPYGFLVAINHGQILGYQGDESVFIISSGDDFNSRVLSRRPVVFASSCYAGAIDVAAKNQSLPMSMISAGARAFVGNTRKRIYSESGSFEEDVIEMISSMYREGNTLGNSFLKAKQMAYSAVAANVRNQMLLDASRNATTEVFARPHLATFYNAEELTLYGDPLAYVS